LAQLVEANQGKRGFTYSHKPATGANREAVAAANKAGFTINLSANNLSHADELAAHEIAPVVVVLPANVQGNAKVHTPNMSPESSVIVEPNVPDVTKPAA